MAPGHGIKASLRAFTPAEVHNIMFYILGIMVYKFGLEAFNGSIAALATIRYDYDASRDGTPSKAFERLGLLQGLNQAFQCFGSIIIAPLMKRHATKNVLCAAIVLFGILTAVLLIVDAATGGTFVPEAYRGIGRHPLGEYAYYGDYNTDGIIPIYALCGIAYGMIELIRRVIPRDIVGGDVYKLRKMDAIVHIFYEIAGICGAFFTGLVLIPQLGNNRAFIITPICFIASAALWFFVSDLGFTRPNANAHERSGLIGTVSSGFLLFFNSIWVGGKILFSSRKFVWLVPTYAVALYAHRYLESAIATQVDKRYFGESSWSQILVGGCNIGELLGALFVFLCTNLVQTPIPWLRLDALLLLIVWYIPFWHPPSGEVSQAWIAAATMIPIAFGWAAGDVSLAAYIQGSLGRLEIETERVSALGAVMAFLYSFYVITYAIVGTVLGHYVDAVYKDTGSIHGALIYTVGMQFTIISLVVLVATFIPSGALAMNPAALFEEQPDEEMLPSGDRYSARKGSEVSHDDEETRDMRGDRQGRSRQASSS